MMEEFFTRKRANEGNKLPLFKPTGEITEHWLLVRGIDSDVFREVEIESQRQAIELSEISDLKERTKRMRDYDRHCVAHLIADWSFDKPCTLENVVDFLREAPQIEDMVNKYAARRAIFFAKKPENSVDGQNQSMNSDDLQKEEGREV